MGPSSSFRRRQCQGSYHPPAINDTKVGDDFCSMKLKWSAAEAPSASNQAWEEDFLSQDLKANVNRQKVVKLLNMYRELSSKLLHKYEAEEQGHIINARRKVWIDVAMYLRRQHKWVNTSKQLGPIPGIEVGDQFQCRAELNIIGLHCQFASGIDYMKKDGVLLATSIVASSRYANVRKSSNSLTYIGHGGNPRVRSVKPTDQKLKQGNLAMMNSMEAKTPVRVVLKVSSSNITYIYDGLYIVAKMTQVRGEFGKLVFSFFLTKISELPSSFSLRKMIYKPKSCVVPQREVVCSNDISQGQEKFPIRVVTSILDDDLKPTPFDYIVKNVYPESYRHHHPMAMPHGCDCIHGCMDNEKCACAVKNGGRVPYNLSRKLTAQTNSLTCECGPSCKCSFSCINRVTQFGIQFQLEIFKTDLKGWGVRTRSFIPSASFVCEYVGEVHLDKEAERRLDVDDCFFKIGVGKGFIDATHRGNVARFINHSCCPNLCVKDVLYDHDDKRFPHKMLFALKNIPAGRELCIDYNCMKGKSNEGISKVGSKNCHCGSVQCVGQIYI